MPKIRDTKVGQVNLDELWEKVNKPNPPLIKQKVIVIGLIEAATFPIVIQCPNLVIECIIHYDSHTCEVRTHDNRLVVKIQRTTFTSCLKLPKREKFLGLDFTNSQIDFSM